MTKKGYAGLDEAEAFTKAFPLQPGEDPLVISTAAFDTWAEGENYYSLDAEQDTVNKCRNTLRGKINKAAAGKIFVKEARGTPFNIQVHNHGKDYVVITADVAMRNQAHALPVKVRSVFATRRAALLALHGSIEMESLPASMQYEIITTVRALGTMQKMVEFGCAQMTDILNNQQADLARLVQSNPIYRTEAIVKAIEAKDDEDEEGDDA